MLNIWNRHRSLYVPDQLFVEFRHCSHVLHVHLGSGVIVMPDNLHEAIVMHWPIPTGKFALEFVVETLIEMQASMIILKQI